MEYESVILKRLIDTYGVVGNPHYISEIIKEFIVQGKECYPNLFTYQADWLAHIDEFGLNPSYTVSYTGHSIYAPNTLERPVKSAILLGNTLVNLCDKTKRVYSADGNKNLWQNVLFNTNPTQLTVINHTDKVIKFTLHNRTTDNWVSTNRVEANSKSLVNCGTNNYLKDLYGAYSDGWSNTEEDRNILKDGILILEGDYTNVNIPYFEGMQSVKMPVLTTSNEDGTKTNILTVNEDVTLRSNGSVYDELDLLTGKLTQRIDENNEVLSQEVIKTVDLTILDQNNQNVEQLMAFNGGTHFITSCTEGSPLPTIVVSVETDLEETLMVCSLEGNTM